MKAVIAVDNERERKLIESVLRNDGDVEKTFSYSNGSDALKAIRKYRPEAVIMELFLPGMDGFSILENISDIKNKYNIKIIGVASVKSDPIIEKAFELGVDYIMLRPYDVNALKRRLMDMYTDAEVVDTGIERQINDSYLEQKISSILNNTGIFPNLKGYKYLKSAIIYGYKDEGALEGVTKVLYPRIARENNTTGDRVERAIRHAIESAWNKYGGNDFYTKMGFPERDSKQRPTNSEYIYAVLEYLKNTIITN